MGQRQSTDNGASEQDAPLKQDYYELLGVERTATEEEIKKAYRRKALELHPDRNYGNEDGATRLFAEVQAAYEILSDPQERAWYDSHRDVLLRGDGSGVEGEEYSYNMRITTSEDVLKFMMKFNKNVEYSDSPSGFYGALNDFFLQLAKEEDIACQWQDIEYREYPEFGSKDDEYEDIVRPFYGAWTGFATKKSYSWKDQYRLQDAPDRRIRRLMEKENQKIRDEAIQDFNDAVRTLIAFVRKRDPRVQNNQVSEAERQKALREAAAAQAARARSQRLEELKKYEHEVIPEWAQSREKDPYEGGFSSESEQEQHEYDCVVCDKTFKSEAQFHAHEKSKKHTKLLKELKRDMQREGKELDLASNPAELNNLTETASHEVPISSQQGSAPSDDMENKQNLSGHEPNNETSTKKKQTEKPQTPASESDEEEIDDDYAPRSKVLDRLVDNDTNTDDLSDRTKSLLLDEDTPATSEPDSLQQPKVGKAKQKKAKRAAKQAAAEDAPQALKCVVCGEDFASKNKLFLHIESEGHAAPPIQTKAGTKNKKTKKR